MFLPDLLLGLWERDNGDEKMNLNQIDWGREMKIIIADKAKALC